MTGREPPRSTARDLERYAGLFARRTSVMKSSAMRDLMAVTARPEIISLAGGLPDTSTFPAEDFAALMARVAVDSSAIRSVTAAKVAGGNVLVSGRPPAIEMTSGRAVTAIRSRMAEDFMTFVRDANSPA